jgi:hypothetical protein
MDKKKLGKFHICQHCGGKFFDLNRAQATCPRCGTVDTPRALPRQNERPTEAPRQREEEIIEEIGDIGELEGEFDGEFDAELDGDFTSVSVEEDFSEDEEEV